MEEVWVQSLVIASEAKQSQRLSEKAGIASSSFGLLAMTRYYGAAVGVGLGVTSGVAVGVGAGVGVRVGVGVGVGEGLGLGVTDGEADGFKVGVALGLEVAKIGPAGGCGEIAFGTSLTWVAAESTFPGLAMGTLVLSDESEVLAAKKIIPPKTEITKIPIRPKVMYSEGSERILSFGLESMV